MCLKDSVDSFFRKKLVDITGSYTIFAEPKEVDKIILELLEASGYNGCAEYFRNQIIERVKKAE